MTTPHPDINKPIGTVGWVLLGTLFLALAYSAWLSYKAIDWTVLKRLEDSPLILPTPIPVNIQTNATPSAKPTK